MTSKRGKKRKTAAPAKRRRWKMPVIPLRTRCVRCRKKRIITLTEYARRKKGDAWMFCETCAAKPRLKPSFSMFLRMTRASIAIQKQLLVLSD